MRHSYWILLFLGFLLFTPAKAKQKPNVIIVITDDQGYGDIAAHGNQIIKTPHLDKLHSESIRLTNFHSGTTCAPSRSGLMTGVHGHRAGVWHTIAGCNILREKYTAMPQVFKNNGYATAMFGKWHLGDAYPYLPENRGFEETVCHGAGGIGQTPDFWDNDYFDDTYMHNGNPQKYKGYCTDVYFAEALKYIEEKKDKPFFVYISTNAPHGPLNVPEKYYRMYENENKINAQQKAYYGMITNIDDNVGMLEKKLVELGLTDNTILVFTTDNGTQYGYRNIKGQEFGYNAGMKGLKGSAYDGGHRVPFFIRWNQGGIKGGKDVESLVMNYDVLPTFVGLCNLRKKGVQDFDGRNIEAVLKDETISLPQRYAVVDKNKTQQPVKWKMCSVMDEEWRLINGKELYNINKDVGQIKDIAAQYPEKVKAMRDAYEKWWDYVSEDFSYFEAYKIGGGQSNEVVITVHDLHTASPVAWSQELIRNPLNGKKPALSEGYWMVDVQEEGEYEIALRRWPKESVYSFNEEVPQLGMDKPWYFSRPKGLKLNINQASLHIGNVSEVSQVDMKKEEVKFKVHLNKGRSKLEANFKTEDDNSFSAFYVYINKI
ncbi:arylsulfatase [Saccharicrinis sp. 156]|uniref:arylsulfatase n=1 Tax=Saccharicrinis sp. 156 TaxID=3417574 RepID=UPI003D339937